MPLSRLLAPWCALCVLLGAPAWTEAQSAGDRGSPVAEGGRSWGSLSRAQQSALEPLRMEWQSIEPSRRNKWIEVADRLPQLPPEEQARVKARMTDWARMSPQERGQARLNYKRAQQMPAQDRKARWEAYKSLSPDQQRELAARSASAQPQDRKPRRVTSPEKSTLVPNPSYAAKPRAIAPSIAQAQPGATTNLVTKRPTPPVHQQPGLPKITAGAGFVDSRTLIPRRGAQGAAVRPAPSASSAVVLPRP